MTITEQQPGLSDRVWQYTYSSSTNQTNRWDMLQPDGTTVSTWYVPSTNGLTNYYWQTSLGTNLLQQSSAAVQYIPSAGFVLTNSIVEGFGGVTQTTTFTYHPNQHRRWELQSGAGQWHIPMEIGHVLPL